MAAPTFTLCLSGLIAVPLQRDLVGLDRVHPDTAALLLGGRHRPVLAIDSEAIDSVVPPLPKPAPVYLDPSGPTAVLIDVEGYDISINEASGTDAGDPLGLHLADWGADPMPTLTDLAAPTWTDLAYVPELAWTDKGAKLSGPAALTGPRPAGAGARLLLDRGLLEALPPHAASRISSTYRFANGRQQQVADGLRLRYVPTGSNTIVLTLRGAAGAIRIRLTDRHSGRVAASLSAICGWTHHDLNRSLDIADYAQLLAAPAALVPPSSHPIGDSAAIFAPRPEKCTPTIVSW